MSVRDSTNADIRAAPADHFSDYNFPPSPPPTSSSEVSHFHKHALSNRFIVSPQVLNAALDLEHTARPAHSPSNSHGGLPPPPRPSSRKGKPSRSIPSSPVGGYVDHTNAPGSPLSPPYSPVPETPQDGSPPVRQPRLSSILRGETLLLNGRRASIAEHFDVGRSGKEVDPYAAMPWTAVEPGVLPTSPQSSLPPSPERSIHSEESVRRQGSGMLQKIKMLGKGGKSGSLSLGSRRMSDADAGGEAGSAKSPREVSRYRRMLDRGVRTAGELMRQPAQSVPNSPVVRGSPGVPEDAAGAAEGTERSGGGVAGAEGRVMGTGGVAVGTIGRRGPSQARVGRAGSHGRAQSEVSSSSAFLASDSSHDPPSSRSTDGRISISSTRYPTDASNHSFDVHLPGRSSMSSPDRSSFIDFSPTSPDFPSQPAPAPTPYRDQPSRHSSGHREDRTLPSRPAKPYLAPLLPTKPPVPTAPKPNFNRRSRSAQPPPDGPESVSTSRPSAPPSSFPSNAAQGHPYSQLNARERAARIRTTQKLTKVFGQTPGAIRGAVSPVDDDAMAGCLPIAVSGGLAPSSAQKARKHRPMHSMVDDLTPVNDFNSGIIWPPPEHTRYLTLGSGARRYSEPLSPDDFPHMSSNHSLDESVRAYSAESERIIEIGTQEGVPDSPVSRRWRERKAVSPDSPRSFIDLSDEETATDGVSEIYSQTPRLSSRGRTAALTPSTASIAESLTSEQIAEEDRRRKREKLAKLHRFLGSRVPPHLVLGPLDEGVPLPPPAPSPFTPSPIDEESDVARVKMRRRRSSSAAEFSRTWSDDIDRLKEDLNDREKAINVRRAVKMEKMFGVAPPQTLYHTRAPVASSPGLAKPRPASAASPGHSPSASSPQLLLAPAITKRKAKKSKRPGTADSATPLIDNQENSTSTLVVTASAVYMHYRHSLNSLNDIIDRDDRESLAELHGYITGEREIDPPTPTQLTVSSPTKSERRRSLPSRTSIASLASVMSDFSITTPTVDVFQQRRRRAQKLTHFFGVDYPDLMNEVLDSLESGLEEERGRGTLRPDEVQELQQKLRSLKTKRQTFMQ